MNENEKRRKGRRVRTRPQAPKIKWRSDHHEDDGDEAPVEFTAEVGAWTLRVTRPKDVDGDYFAALWNDKGESIRMGTFDDVTVAMRRCEDLGLRLLVCPWCGSPITTSAITFVAGAAAHAADCGASLARALQ